MSFFTRMRNIFRGFFSLLASDVERNNPAIAFENAINGMLVKYNNAKRAVANILANRLKVEERLNRQVAELNQVNSDLEAALDTDQDDLAELLVQKQEALTRQVEEGKVELERLSAQAEDSKAMLISFQGEINKIKAERDEMLAKNEVAKAQIAVQDQLSGLSVDSEIRALDNVREGIRSTVAQAQLNHEMAGTDVDARLAKLRQTAGSTNAKSKVAALKAARQADAQKTL